jgi:hypothetical protein
LPPISLNGDGLGPTLKGAFDDAGLPDLQKLILRQRQPALMNRYRRHYFISADGHFRLTIDSELQFATPQPSKSSRGFYLLVIELKFSPRHADAAPLVTNSFPFRIARCSKYILGMQSL